MTFFPSKVGLGEIDNKFIIIDESSNDLKSRRVLFIIDPSIGGLDYNKAKNFAGELVDLMNQRETMKEALHIANEILEENDRVKLSRK